MAIRTAPARLSNDVNPSKSSPNPCIDVVVIFILAGPVIIVNITC